MLYGWPTSRGGACVSLGITIVVDGQSPELLGTMASWKGCCGSIESGTEGYCEEQGVTMSRTLDNFRVLASQKV